MGGWWVGRPRGKQVGRSGGNVQPSPASSWGSWAATDGTGGTGGQAKHGMFNAGHGLAAGTAAPHTAAPIRRRARAPVARSARSLERAAAAAAALPAARTWLTTAAPAPTPARLSIKSSRTRTAPALNRESSRPMLLAVGSSAAGAGRLSAPPCALGRWPASARPPPPPACPRASCTAAGQCGDAARWAHACAAPPANQAGCPCQCQMRCKHSHVAGGRRRRRHHAPSRRSAHSSADASSSSSLSQSSSSSSSSPQPSPSLPLAGCASAASAAAAVAAAGAPAPGSGGGVCTDCGGPPAARSASSSSLSLYRAARASRGTSSGGGAAPGMSAAPEGGCRDARTMSDRCTVQRTCACNAQQALPHACPCGAAALLAGSAGPDWARPAPGPVLCCAQHLGEVLSGQEQRHHSARAAAVLLSAGFDDRLQPGSVRSHVSGSSTRLLAPPPSNPGAPLRCVSPGQPPARLRCDGKLSRSMRMLQRAAAYAAARRCRRRRRPSPLLGSCA